MSGVGTMALPTDNTQVSTVQTPNAAADTSAYTQQVQQSLQPQFTQAQQQLAAQQAAMGTLSSGQGNQGLQDLYAGQNATVAGLVAPMIQQGNAEQYGANTTNAGAANAYQTLLQNQVYGAGQNSINNNLQAQEFNAGSANNAQLAQLGYSNSDYQQQMAELAGLQSQGLGGQVGTLGTGVGQQLNAYTSGYQNLMPYLQQTGVGQGYGTTGTVPTNTGTSGTSQALNNIGYYGGSPYPGGIQTITPGSGEGQDPAVPVNVSGGGIGDGGDPYANYG